MAKVGLVLMGICVGCGGGGGSAGGDGSGGEAKPPPPPPRVTCADLAGAPRFGLQASKDGKTLYYVDETSKKIGEERQVSWNLYSYDVASKAAKLMVSDVSPDAYVAADGTVVYRKFTGKLDFMGKKQHVLAIVPPGKEAIVIQRPAEGEEKGERENDVSEFVVDAESQMIAFVTGRFSPDELWKVPLAGGKAEKIGEHAYRIVGLVDKSVVHGGMSGLHKQPLTGGKATDTEFPFGSYLIGSYGGKFVLQDKFSKAVSVVPFEKLGDKTPPKRGGLEYEDITLLPYSKIAIAQKAGAKDQEVLVLDGDALKPLVVTSGARPSSIVQLGDQLAMLVISDTDGDGERGTDDEADLCFAKPGEPLALPERAIPKRFNEVATRLGSLTKEGELAGAKLRFTTESTLEHAVFSIAKGPSDLDKLRALVKATQEKVTKASGLAQLSVTIEVRENGRRAISRWDGRAGQFLTSAGMGTAQVVDKTQYKAEVDPKVSLSISRDPYSYGQRESSIGDATCSGTVKNVSDAPLENIEVECSNMTFGRESIEKVKLVPNKLAPNATGTYKIKLGVIDGNTATPLTIYSGGTRIAYLNAFGTRRAEAILDVAAKVHGETKLAYWSMFEGQTGASYDRKKVVKVFLHVDDALASGTNSARETAAAAAMKSFSDYIEADKQLEGTPVVYLLRPGSYTAAWTYQDGKLVEGEPRSPF